ncbi:Transposon Tf2-6 polyprotein, partial [Aduncisulcus paluster]
MSKTLTSQEAKHTTTEKEAYAIFYCISKAEYHLRGRKFTLHTDHQNLLYIHTRSSAKVERWRTFLADFTFDSVHVKGRQNQLADALSRLGHQVVKVDQIPNDEHDADLIRHRPNHVKTFKKPLKPSKDCPPVYIDGVTDKPKLPAVHLVQTEETETSRRILTKKRHEKWLARLKTSQTAYLKDTENLDKRNGLYVRRGCAIIPSEDKALVKEVLSDAHDNAFAGHVGIGQMIDHLKDKKLYLRNAKEEARSYILKCGICQKMKARRLVKLMMKDTTVSTPFDTVAIDTVGPIMPSKAGSRYMIVMVDCFTRWTEIVPTKRAKATDAADALISGIFGRFGLPNRVRSDRGTQYVNELLTNLYEKLGIKQHKVLAYHPQANGIVERTNQEVVRHMRVAALRVKNNEEWEKLIPIAQYV